MKIKKASAEEGIIRDTDEGWGAGENSSMLLFEEMALGLAVGSGRKSYR